MANQTLISKIQLRNDIRANWNTNNPVLLAGEIGLETDTRLFKVGDGTKTWNELAYEKGQPAELKTVKPEITDANYEVGQVWINTTNQYVYILLDNTPNAAVWKRLTDEDSLGTTKQALTMGSKTFDGSAAVTLEAHDIGALTKTDYATAEGGVVVTSNDDNGVAVDAATGKMTVNTITADKISGVVAEAAKVTNSLTAGSKIYNGTAAVEITAADLNAVTHTDIATAEKAGIVKGSAAENQIAVDENGLMNINTISGDKITGTVANAAKVGNSLTMGAKTFNGSEAVTLTAADLGAVIPTDYGTAEKGGTVKSSDGENKVAIGADGTMTINAITADKLTGPVAEADKLTTARKINGVDFDGTADITIADDTKIALTEKGAANGVATLDANGLVPASQLPSYVDDVIELLTVAGEAPATCEEGDKYFNTTDNLIYTATGANVWGTGVTPEEGKIYVALDTNYTYRWSGSALIAIDNPLDYATVEEAIAGVENTKVMTALRVKEAIEAQRVYATETAALAYGQEGTAGVANTIARGDHTHTLPAITLADLPIVTNDKIENLDVAKLYVADEDILVINGGGAAE